MVEYIPKSAKERYIYMLLQLAHQIESKEIKDIYDYLRMYQAWKSLLNMLLSYAGIILQEDISNEINNIENEINENLSNYIYWKQEGEERKANDFLASYISSCFKGKNIIQSLFSNLIGQLSSPKYFYLEINENDIEEVKKKIINEILNLTNKSLVFIVAKRFDENVEKLLNFIDKKQGDRYLRYVDEIIDLKKKSVIEMIRRNKYGIFLIRRSKILTSKKMWFLTNVERIVVFNQIGKYEFSIGLLDFKMSEDRVVIKPLLLKIGNEIMKLVIKLVN